VPTLATAVSVRSIRDRSIGRRSHLIDVARAIVEVSYRDALAPSDEAEIAHTAHALGPLVAREERERTAAS
jgi:hypothetical protein